MSSVFFPVDKIKDYYGENIAIYFEWLNFYMLWLSVPAVLSILLVMRANFSGISLEENYSYSLYSFFIVIWGTLFSKYWKRKSAAL